MFDCLIFSIKLYTILSQMQAKAIKTDKIKPEDNLSKILDKFLKKFKEKEILAITSKIVSVCEGKIENLEQDKDELIRQEADFYLPRNASKYGYSLTIKRNVLAPAAGIDESNADGKYILLPENPQKTANEIRSYLLKRFKLKHAGVIITDSKSSPLRRGTTGIALSHSGFRATRSYLGKPDIFSRKLNLTNVNDMDSLAATAVFVMGEGNEQTPIAVISDVPFVNFRKTNPSKKELENFYVSMEDDLYAPLLTKAPWKKGKLHK